jgi:integrase/recombinase XerD
VPELTIVAPKPATAIERLVEDFLTSGRARGLSPKTIREGYGYPLRQILLPWCAREGIVEPKQLSAPRLLDRLTAQLLEEGGKRGPLSRHSVHTYVRAINVFLAWAYEQGELDGRTRAQTPQVPKHLIDVLSREEIQAMEDLAPTERDKLIVRLLADSGIRVGELVGLRVGDLVEQGRSYYIKVEGKGSRQRLVPVPRLYRRLQRYALRGRPKDVRGDRLFVSLRRRGGGDYEPLTASGVAQMVRNLGEMAGIKKRIYPHLFRHSFITHQLNRGMNPVQLAAIVGHSSLTMIQQVYAHLTPQDAYEAMLKTLTEA